MHWNHHKLIVGWTAAMVFLSSNSGRQIERLPDATRSLAPMHTLAAAHTLAPTHTTYNIYLTFDDGPSSGSRLVNELSEKDSLPVNVFLIGRNVCGTDKNRQVFREYQANPLVEIGNHSYTHAERQYKKYFGRPAEVLADFDRTRDSLHLTNGFSRLPGRNFFRLDLLARDDLSNGKAAADTLAARGYYIFGWDLEWRRQPAKGIDVHTGKEMLDIVAAQLEKHKTFLPGRLIILLHDSELTDEHFKNELEEFIRLARTDGFRFEHLSQYTTGL